MKTNINLARQGIILTIIGIIISLSSFIKEMLFASNFGVSEVADAYTVAIQIPTIIFAFVWEGINAILIPLYTKVREQEGAKAGGRFIANLFGCIGGFILIFLFFGELFAHGFVYIFSPGMKESTRIVAVGLMRYMLPVMFFEGIIRICEGVLQVHRQFIVSKVLAGIRNMVAVLFLIFLSKKIGITAAALGILAGMATECIVTVMVTGKHERLFVSFDIKDETIHKAFKMAVPVIIAVGAGEINHIIDKMIASYLPEGSIIALNYADKLGSIIRTLLFGNILVLVFPILTSAVAKGAKENFSELFWKACSICSFVCLPIACGGLVLRKEIVGVVFERGIFTAEDTALVSALFGYYLVTAFFTTMSLLCTKTFVASYNTKLPMLVSSVEIAVNIILNIILSQIFGVTGLAMATMFSALIRCTISFFFIKWKITEKWNKRFFLELGKIVIAAFIMSSIVLLFRNYIAQSVELGTLYGKLVCLLLTVFVGGIIYVFLSFILKIKVKEYFREWV